MSAGTALQKRDEVMSLVSERRRDLAAFLVGQIDPDRWISALGMALVKQPAILDCDPASVAFAAFQAAELGLTIGSAIPHAHLVPFGKQCQMIVDYRGLLYLAVRAGAITKGDAVLVYDGDLFQDVRGSEPRLIHEPRYETSGADAVRFAYFIATMPDGSKKWEVMTRRQLEDIRARAKKGKGPWDTDTEEMYRKTVLKRGLKYIAIGEGLNGQTGIEVDRLTHAIETDNELAGVVEPNPARNHRSTRPTRRAAPAPETPKVSGKPGEITQEQLHAITELLDNPAFSDSPDDRRKRIAACLKMTEEQAGRYIADLEDAIEAREEDAAKAEA